MEPMLLRGCEISAMLIAGLVSITFPTYFGGAAEA